MKKSFTFFLLVNCLINLAQVPTPTLYFGITSHNEPAEVYSTTATYNPVRDTLKKIVDLIYAKNARYNLQTNPSFVQGCLVLEQAATTATDILEYANKIGGIPSNIVEIDPRYKGSSFYNIADVSYSITLTGAQSSKIVGGYIYFDKTTPPGTYTLGDWLPYTLSITAQNTPTYSWKADIIWGGGSLPPHTKDLENYGVWKPRGKQDSIDYYCHDPNQTVWNQGNGCGWVLTPTTNVNSLIAEIRTEATKIKNGTYPANKFYNGHLMINFKDFGTSTVTPSFQMPATLSRILDSINVMVSQGKIIWNTITQKQNSFAAWSSSTGIAFSQWKCGQTVTLSPTCAPNKLNEYANYFDIGISIFPNPANDQLHYVWDNSFYDLATISFYDHTGKWVLTESVSNSKGTLNVGKLPSGIYFIVVKNRSGQSDPRKLLINH